tara:strand:- start:699 stop:1166 length:468 start_codon:yes stop_codon:yes gene_type:complete
MAKNTNKRTATKHIRDGIKSKYQKGSCCEVCGTEQDLELHHYHTVSLLLDDYCKENGITLETDQDAIDMREDFYEAHMFELVEDMATLCNKHHVQLHSIYGKQPALSTADKQRNWVKKMAAKAGQTTDVVASPSEDRWAMFLDSTSECDRFTKFL